jgi:hypothetical protein
MKKRPEVTADRFTSRVSVVASNGNTYNVIRDDDGDYKIEDVLSETTVYIGPVEVAGHVAEAINDLLAAAENDK